MNPHERRGEPLKKIGPKYVAYVAHCGARVAKHGQGGSYTDFSALVLAGRAPSKQFCTRPVHPSPGPRGWLLRAFGPAPNGLVSPVWERAVQGASPDIA